MLLNGLITACKTLTILRLPGQDSTRLTDALIFFPLVGALIGGLLTGLTWLIGAWLGWPNGAAAAGVILLAWITGGLHLDGLGDSADAYAPGRPRERMLAIMKDHHLGAFGATAIAAALLLKTIALAQLVQLGQWTWMPIPFILSRLIMVLLAVTLPYARAEGGGAGAFVKQARPKHLLGAAGLALLLSLLLLGWAGGLILLLAGLLGWPLASWMRRSFGGVTGDLLGLANETSECILLFTLAALAPYAKVIHAFSF